MTTRTDDVTNDGQNPLAKATVTIAGGASGSASLYEDDGTSPGSAQSATTQIRYTEGGPEHVVHIDAAAGSFVGQVSQRQWSVAFLNATPPTTVTVNGKQAAPDAWTWDAATRTLTVDAPAQSVHSGLVVSYQ
jgi:hypothetical protein